MAEKFRELAHRIRAARADGMLRLPWEKPLPSRDWRSVRVGGTHRVPWVTMVSDSRCDSADGRRHRNKEPMPKRIRRGLQALDEWLELPDMARKVLIKAGKIAGTGLTALGVGRLCYFELKRLREKEGSEPVTDGYEHARSSVLSYVRGQPCEDPSATFVQSVKNLFNPFYVYKKPDNEEPAQNPTKIVEKKENEKQMVAEDKETPESKGSGSGQVLQGPEAPPKK